MTRIPALFERLKQENRSGLIAYITAGDPCPERTPSLIAALEEGGVDLLELGVPFSDPVGDGPVIQRASERALQAGTSLARVLDIASEVRRRSDIPIVLFTYLNPVLRYGTERLVRDAVERGIDGCLLIDLSVEEAASYVETMRRFGMDAIFLAAPTSSAKRCKLIAEHSTGFVYLVSRAGVTGEKDSVSAALAPLVASMRSLTNLPLAAGFGISKPEHAAEVGAIADAVAIGSAFVRTIEQHMGDALEQRLTAQARGFRDALFRSSA